MLMNLFCFKQVLQVIYLYDKMKHTNSNMNKYHNEIGKILLNLISCAILGMSKVQCHRKPHEIHQRYIVHNKN